MTAKERTQLSHAASEAVRARRYPPELLTQIDQSATAHFEADAWLSLFQGRRLCRLHSRFREASALIDRAVRLFRAADDGEGELWALAEHVVLCYHSRDAEIGLEVAQQALARAMRPYLRAEFEFGRFLCLIATEQVAESIAAGEAALAALDQEEDHWLQLSGRVQMLRNIAAGYHYVGQIRRSTAAAEQAVALAQQDEDLASARPWCWYELALAYWRQGRLSEARDAVESARRLAEAWHHQELWRWAVGLQAQILRDQNDLDQAMAAYQLAGSWGEVLEGPALLQIRQDRLAEARWSCEMLAKVSDDLWRSTDAPTLLAIVELKSGNPQAALELLAPVSAIHEDHSFFYHAATSHLYYAAACLAVGDHDQAAAHVGEYLRFAAREDLLTCRWWVPDLIEPLLLFALHRGIEVAHAQRILEQRFLGGSAADSGPRPIAHAYDTAELVIARQMQLALLPDAPPHMPGLDVAATVLPASEVGGDFVGYFPFGAALDAADARALGIAVGDISGKGLAAALLLSGAVVALNTVAAGAAPPVAVAQALHAAIQPYTTRSRMNIALCYTMLTETPRGWNVCAVGCGSVPPLIRRASGEVLWLDTAGLPLGTVATAQYADCTEVLRPGDTMLLLSDGVIEALDGRRRMFGFEQLERTLAQVPPDADATTTRDLVMQAVAGHSGSHEQHDDITLVVVRAMVAGCADAA